MKKYLLLTLFLPLFSFGEQCDTIYPSQYADTIIYCVTDASCHDICDGSLVVDVRGVNQPYSYSWNVDGNSSPFVAGDNSRDSLCANQYIISIIDGNGNLVNNTYVNDLISPPNFTLFEDSVKNPSCFNYADGEIYLSIGGATPPYTYSWYPSGVSTLDRTALDSGTYILTSEDANGCIQTDTFDLDNPLKVNSQTMTDTLSCIGACDGDGVVIPNSGFTPYSFLWDDPLAQITATATGLCYGLSTVYITDSMGCLDTNTVFIENPDTLKLSNITIDNACYQICDGQLSVTIEGGTSPYDTEWSLGGNVFNTPQPDETENTLCPGNYQIKFTDANDCVDSVIIPLIERDSFVVQDWIIDDSCYNSCTGQITVQLLNQDNPPFIYAWDNGGTDTIISNLCSDTFELILIDDRLCKDTFEFFVDEPDSLSYDAIEVIHNLCYGDEAGVITIVNLTGGVIPITYSWSNGASGPTPGISSLPADMYSVHIEDANECAIDVANIEVIESDSLHVFYTPVDASCFGYSDGSISINLSGGTTPYRINGVLLSANDTIISNLAAGQYLYTILDSNNCDRPQDTITVEEPDILEIDTILTQVLCHEDSTGSIDLTVIGGTAAYSYLWSNSDTTQDLLNIGEGTYAVLVTDNQGCTDNGTYTITEPQFPITYNIVGTNILCNGDNTGFADLTVNGGTTPYSFQWSNADTTEDISNLLAGTYIVDIIDANDCTADTTINIVESALITITYNETSVLCNGDSTGSVDLTVSGGVSPYTYLWSTGDITQNLDSIPAGTYSVTVTDINLCTETLSLNVSEPSELVSSLTNTNIDCYGYNNGSVDLTATGGAGSYSFFWSNNESTANIDNLIPGDYIVVITDGNGCILSDTSTITEPTELIITSSYDNVDCNGGESGSIDITATGGTGALSYIWSNGSNSEDLNNIPAGNYTVDVTDANGCQESEFFVITQPNPFLETGGGSSPVNTCNGDATGSIDFSVVGNTPSYTYQWSNNATSASIANLTAGNYTVDVTDAKGCDTTYSYLITEPDALLLDYIVKPASCEEKDDGAIYASVTGGIPPISYDWSNGEEGQDILDLSKGIYSLQVEDANGCTLPLEAIEVNFDGFDGCIEIPSGFTPNGDGIHDEWSIYGLYYFPDVVVKVYNRWGQEMYSSEGYEIPWDGKYQGADLPTATYYYVIQFTDSGKVFNGTVTIKR